LGGEAVNDKAENSTAKFDWVTARSSCSLPKVFQELRLQAEGDVKTRNGLRPNNSPYEFSVKDNVNEFTVLLEAKVEGKDVHRSIIFSLTEHAILVQDGRGTQMFEVTLTLNEQGECKLTTGGKERDFWQVRRMALEELLFRGL
jgi:hypothetical protein